MKKIFMCVFLCLLATVAIQAQEEVTRFLGIPVDGTEEEMILKLKEKGFRIDEDVDMLRGEFNGEDVYVTIATNKGKVRRIGLSDVSTRDEEGIRRRFNTLCEQFVNNEKYISASLSDYVIQDDEDIQYEMNVHDKQYEAAFYQLGSIDTMAIYNEVVAVLADKYTEEQLSNPNEDLQVEMFSLILAHIMESQSKRLVWFKIMESYGEYRILMMYDNVYNEAHGEDL